MSLECSSAFLLYLLYISQVVVQPVIAYFVKHNYNISLKWTVSLMHGYICYLRSLHAKYGWHFYLFNYLFIYCLWNLDSFSSLASSFIYN